MKSFWLLALLGLFIMVGVGAGARPGKDPNGPQGVPQQPLFSALIFSKTAGFRHDSAIRIGTEAIRQLAADYNFVVDATEDAAWFTKEFLAYYNVVIFLNTTGDILNREQEEAFERYIGNGGGFVGIHAATDTEYDWPWYGQLVGAYFRNHPEIQQAFVYIEDGKHFSTAYLPEVWVRTDEWYNFEANPRPNVHVLAVLDETSYNPGPNGMGEDHPISWCRNFDGGRSWYTAMGHTDETYREEFFLNHLLGGIFTAAGVVEANCGP